jgi:hypothetical protein
MSGQVSFFQNSFGIPFLPIKKTAKNVNLLKDVQKYVSTFLVTTRGRKEIIKNSSFLVTPYSFLYLKKAESC